MDALLDATRLKANHLKLFSLRCCDIADRVTRNEIGFLDGVDLAYDAACASGLVEAVGDDVVQAAMAAAFANAPRRP
jgi:hypothetical protein